jgi:hypothetical protein
MLLWGPGIRLSPVLPVTGGWGDANAGGNFGPHLKMAGYDAVFFTGISDKPVYLYIDEEKVELRDAGNLWGKNTYEVEDMLENEYGKNTGVVTIGISGEKLIAYLLHRQRPWRRRRTFRTRSGDGFEEAESYRCQRNQ